MTISPDALAATVTPVGQAVDAAARALPILHRDRQTAMFYVLTAYADAIRLPLVRDIATRDALAVANSDNVRLSMEMGITDLVRLISKQCLEGTWPVPMGDVPDQDLYGDAVQALRFVDNYHVVRTALEDVMNGRRTILVDGTRVYIDYPEGGIEHEARINVAQRFGASPEARPPAFTVLALDTTEAEDITDAVLGSIVVTSGCTFTYEAPDEARRFFSDLAESAVVLRELDRSVSVAGYTAGEVQVFYRVLYAKAAMHQAYCWASGRLGVIGNGSGSLPLAVTEPDLEDALVKSGLLTGESFRRILQDLTYDVEIKRADIFFQPLLAVAPDTYIVSPMVVTASSRERNLQKLWAIKYPKAYSAKVGEKKVRLAADLARAFADLGFRTAATRLLTESNGALIGDVDVGVFDDREDLLALIELKWLIASAEGYEAHRNDAEVQAGTEQARASAAFVEKQPAEAMALLFPGEAAVAPKLVQPLLIVRGHLPTIAVLTRDVPIVGYDLVMAYLAGAKRGIRLRALLHDVTEFLNRIRPSEHYYVDDEHLSLGGFDFTFRALGITPRALFVANEVVPTFAKVGKNALCPCGSGRKYKRCHG